MTPITDPSAVRLGHWYSIDDQPERMIASDSELSVVSILLSLGGDGVVVHTLSTKQRAEREAQVQADAQRMQAGA